MDLTFNCPDTVLMLGNESEHMSDAQLVSAARFAAKLGFRAITFKVGDGTIRYRNAKEVETTIDAINNTGMGALPFLYIYGPRFSDTQIKQEAAIIQELADDASDTVVVDMESEWNNNPRACALLRDSLKSFMDNKRSLVISTWADPVQQGWVQNIVELNPLVEKYGAWSPQQYSIWLAQQEAQLHNAKGDIFPEVNMMVEPLAVAKQASLKRHKSLWVWYYQSVESMQLLAKSVVQTFVKGEETHVIPVAKPPVTPIVSKPVVTPPVTPQPDILQEAESWLNSGPVQAAVKDVEQVASDLVNNPGVQKDVEGTALEALQALITHDYSYIINVNTANNLEDLGYQLGVEVEHILKLNPVLVFPLKDAQVKV